MKAIIGVDAGGGYENGVALFKAMAFQNMSPILVSAVDTTPPIMPFLPESAAVQADFVAQSQEASKAALQAAAASLGENTPQFLVFGGASPVLIRTAEEQEADLLVVHSTVRAGWETLLIGSVSKSLALHSPVSVLVSKGDHAPDEMRVVFATDHSEYANRALEKFLSFGATGIKSFHLVTAYDLEQAKTQLLISHLNELSIDLETFVREKLSEKSASIVERLRAAGMDATFSVVAGDVNRVIETTMQEQSGNLLVVGAQGHGFFERVLTGSVATHQVTHSPYSVLVVRA